MALTKCSCTGGQDILEADKVLITTAVKLLQQQAIEFRPALPTAKTGAIQRVSMGDGIKIFVEFKERFYPDFLAFGKILPAFREEEKFVYDAAFGKDSTRNVLALFAINDKAAAYTDLASEEEILAQFLEELDEIFDGQATSNYLQHRIQNWSKEPYIQGAYSYGFEGDQEEIVAAIQAPVNGKLYFAGEALSVDNQAMVHGACESAFGAVAAMLAS